MDYKNLWQQVITILEKRVSKAHLLTYFQETVIKERLDREIVLGTTNPFTLETLKMRYSNDILEVIQSFLPEIEEISFVTTTIKKEDKVVVSKAIESEQKRLSQPVKGIHSNLFNPKYHFQNFVTGENNELAYAVAKNIVQEPGKKYNPVFIYGEVGLGKTHLLQAIGNEMLKKEPQGKVIYTTTEQFMNDMIDSINKGKTENFRKKYRNIQALIIDDIQFLSNKEKTQEEFFHTFNVLYDQNKQIIISADKAPHEIKGIPERLVSRFQAGMITEIAQPDTNTRLAILQKKSQELSHVIPNETLMYIAENISGNIRQMEGILQQILARIELTGKMPEQKSIELLLKSHSKVIQSEKKIQPKVQAQDILEKVGNIFHITVEDIIGNSRKQEFSTPRQIAMYCIRKKLNKSYEDIGAIFSNRNHATIMHAMKKIRRLIDSNKDIHEKINKILQ